MQLYPHQGSAVQWLQKTPRAGFFDDQGLGKTISALVAAGDQPITIVCPTAVLGNWRREAQLWLEDCDNDHDVQVLDKTTSRLRGHPRVAITTHGLLRNDWIRGQLVFQRNAILICDECQFLRNHTAKMSRMFFEELVPTAEQVWMLSGTPMPNTPSDLWMMGHHLWPELFPEGYDEFRDKFCILKARWFNGVVRVSEVGSKNLPELRERMKGVSLRRLKTDELDLPPMRYEHTHIDAPWPSELQQLEDEMRSTGEVHDDEWFARVMELFSISEYRRLCGEAKAQPVADMLTLELEADPTAKRVVFCHHVGVGIMLHNALRQFGAMMITGSVTAKQRTTNVERFQTDPNCRVAICNIVAGGTGITLTAADDVVFAEMSYSPGDMLQAIDRIYRIGQTRPCRARMASLNGSIDEQMTQILQRKMAAIREVMR